MTFSPLISGNVPHHNKQSSLQGASKQYLTVHHWAGIVGGDTRLLNPSEAVSCNYILYSTGRLVGQVSESMRAWTSGSWEADAPGVTVETQNTGGRFPGGTGDLDPRSWPVSDAALEKLAQLAADLSVRHGWGLLDRSRVRGHREFASTACPGGFLWHRLDYIISRGNEILTGKVKKELEKQMTNPIINVVPRNALMIGRDDGTFEEYATPRAMNSRGIISVAFFGAKSGEVDEIPSLSLGDFEVVKTVWSQMCKGRAGATDTESIKLAVREAVAAQGVTVDADELAQRIEAALADEFAAIPSAVNDDAAKRLAG